MGPALGSDCRDLVVPIVVTQVLKFYLDLLGCLLSTIKTTK